MTTIKAILVFATVALTGCSQVGVVGEFGRYNEAFSGVVEMTMTGATMVASTSVTKASCKGVATGELTGYLDMLCDDGRRLTGRWVTTNGGFGRGVGEGQDQYGNAFRFEYGMSVEEAKKVELTLVNKKRGRPSLPHGDASKLLLFTIDRSDGIESPWEIAEQARSVCLKKGEGGSLSTNYDTAMCSQSSVKDIYSSAHFPHMDLIDLLLSHRLVMAQQADEGKISVAEMNMRELEIVAKLNTAVMQREDATRQNGQGPAAVYAVAPHSGMSALGTALNDLNQELQMQNMQNRMNQMQWDMNTQRGYQQQQQIYDPGVPSPDPITCQFGC